MRLFMTLTSPYARIARIALLEAGLDSSVAKVELTRDRLYSPESDVLSVNPGGRVPTLELDDGAVLTESKLILDFIHAQRPNAGLIVRDGSDGWRMMADLGQAHGLLDSIVTLFRFTLLPEAQRSAPGVAYETARTNRALDGLEIAAGIPGRFNAAHIVLGCALSLLSVRMPAWDWRSARPRLAAWFDAISERPSFKATMPPG